MLDSYRKDVLFARVTQDANKYVFKIIKNATPHLFGSFDYKTCLKSEGFFVFKLS